MIVHVLQGNEISNLFTKKILKDAYKNIKFFENTFSECDYKNLYFIILYDEILGKLIGVSNFGIYNNKYWGLSYISIHKEYRNKGYSKILINETLKFLEEEGIDKIELSLLTEEGKLCNIGKNFIELSKNFKNINVILSWCDRE